MAMTDTDTQGKLAEYEGIIRMLTEKVEELAAANERLTSELTAHQTLKAIYADPNQPATVRVRAAQAALNVETPRLEPQPAPLELAAEEIEPLAVGHLEGAILIHAEQVSRIVALLGAVNSGLANQKHQLVIIVT
jgi:hypothetical protein